MQSKCRKEIIQDDIQPGGNRSYTTIIFLGMIMEAVSVMEQAGMPCSYTHVKFHVQLKNQTMYNIYFTVTSPKLCPINGG